MYTYILLRIKRLKSLKLYILLYENPGKKSKEKKTTEKIPNVLYEITRGIHFQIFCP